MKLLMISILSLTVLLYADDVVEFDNVQELMQWHEQKQLDSEDDDMAIIKIENSKIVETVIEVESDENSIESLPDATVVEMDQKVEEIKNDTVTTKLSQENSDIESLPLAKFVEEKQIETKTVEAVDEVTKITQDKNESKPITIVKYAEKPNSDVCGTTVKEEIDFWRLLDEAMLKATAMILKKHDIQITQKNLDVVKSEYYPNISLGYSGEYYHGYSRDGSSIGGSFYPGISQYRDSLDLSLKHELYRFGATDLKMQISQKDIEIVKSELALVQQDLSNELLSDFMQVVKSQENLKFKEDMRLVQDRIIQKKWRLYEAGQVSKTVLLRDQLTLANLEKDILKHKMNFMDFVKKIQILTNVEIDPNLTKFAIPTPKNREIVPFEQSAVSKNLKLKLEKKLQEIELTRKDYKPGIYANSSYRFYGADNDSFTKTIKNLEKNSWDVGVSLRWELFSGFKTDSTVERAKIEVQKLVEQYRLAKVDYESRKMKREMLKEAIDKILRVEAQILDQTCEQEDLMGRLESAGQVSSIELDNIELNKLRSKLDFRLGVIDRVNETISSELIL